MKGEISLEILRKNIMAEDMINPESSMNTTELTTQGVDLAYLQTGISRVFFWVLNFENLYFFGQWSQPAVFFGFLNKCCILNCFIFLTVFFGSSFMYHVLQ